MSLGFIISIPSSKPFNFILLALLMTLPAKAWRSDGYCQSIVTDKAGNSFVTGYFYNKRISFGAVTLTNSSTSDEIFIVKYDADGHVVWAKSAGGKSIDKGTGIAIDASGNCYITGEYWLQANFDSISISCDSQGMFIAKYDPQGNVVWVKNAASINEHLAYSNSITADTDGNIFLTGNFYIDLTFDTTSLIANGGYADIFIAKYDSKGNFVWANKAGGAAFDEGKSIAIDNSGNCYVTGEFVGTATFNDKSLSSNGAADIFVAKYNSTGKLVWVQKTGGEANEVGNDIAIEVSGNCYVVGSSMDYIDGYKIFLAQYDSQGNTIRTQKFEGKGEGCGDGIAVDDFGNIYITGWIHGRNKIGSNSVWALNMDVFIAKFNSSANPVWVKRISGRSLDGGTEIKVDRSGNIYLIADYRGSFSLLLFSKYGSTITTKFDPSGKELWRQRIRRRR